MYDAEMLRNNDRHFFFIALYGVYQCDTVLVSAHA